MSPFPALFLTLISISAVVGRQKMIIDHDGGADDAMAIVLALIYEQHFNGPEVIALTTSHGNVAEDQVFINSQRILHVAGRSDVPIYRGSNFSLVIDVPTDFYYGKDGLGDNHYDEFVPIEAQAQPAALGIIELAKQHEGEIVLVSLGALTNVALALRLYPALLSKLAQVFVAAGNVYGKKSTSPEFNAEQDVEAYHAVVKNACPDKLTIIPFSQVKPTSITKEWRMNVLGAIPTQTIKALNEFERLSIADSSTLWSQLDPVGMAIVLDEAVVGDIKYSENSIHLCGEIVLVSLGALTNVALALRLYPALLSKLAQVFVAAGNVYGKKSTSPEFNAEQDVEAYHAVVKNACPDKLTIIPFSQVKPTSITKEWRMNVLGAIPTQTIKALNEFERLSIADSSTLWSQLDPVGMAIVLDEAVVGDIKYSENSIHLCGEIVLVSLGALTNVALALRLYPALLSKLAQVFVAAGNVYGKKSTSPEFNAEQDVEAYHAVVKNACPDKLTIIPFSQVKPTSITKEWRMNVLGAIPTQTIKALNEFERLSIADSSTLWSQLDPVGMAIVLDEAVVGDIKYSENSIHLCGENRGININKFTSKEDANVRVINGLREDKYQNLLLSAFSAELS